LYYLKIAGLWMKEDYPFEIMTLSFRNN